MSQENDPRGLEGPNYDPSQDALITPDTEPGAGRAAAAKDAAGAAFQATEPAPKKSRKGPTILAIVAVAALVGGIGGGIVGAKVSNANAYNAAVAEHNEVVDLNMKQVGVIADAHHAWPETLEVHADLRKNLATAAKAPEGLVSKKVNAPVVKLSKEISSKKTDDYEAVPEAPELSVTDKLEAIEGLGISRAQAEEAEAQLKGAQDETVKVVGVTDDELTAALLVLTDETSAAGKAVAGTVKEALSNEKSWTKAHPKGDAKAFAEKAELLEKAKAGYDKSENGEAKAATALVKAQAEYVTAALALQKAHDDVVAAEAAAAAQAAAEAEAAAAAQAAAEAQWVDPGPVYSGGGNDWTPPPANNNGGGNWSPPPPPPNNGGGGGGGGGGDLGGHNPGGGGPGCWTYNCAV